VPVTVVAGTAASDIEITYRGETVVGSRNLAGLHIGKQSRPTFRIHNRGNVVLTFATPAVILTEMDGATVTVGRQPVSSIPPGGNSDVVLAITPTYEEFQVDVNLMGMNDSDDPTVSFTVRGQADPEGTSERCGFGANMVVVMFAFLMPLFWRR